MSKFETASSQGDDPTYDPRIEKIMIDDILNIPLSEEDRTYMQKWLEKGAQETEADNYAS
jgi:hypothetical protein